jgi:hypothetical protein
MHSITITRIKKTNIALNIETDSCERFFGDGHIRMVFAIYVYVDVDVARGVRFGFPFPETRNPGTRNLLWVPGSEEREPMLQKIWD